MPFAMFDSVNLDEIPPDAPAVAGYTTGKWPTFAHLAFRWPTARRLSIAVTAKADADCLDIEPGDATRWDAPSWVTRQHRRGLARPWLYASVSEMPHVLDVLAQAGITREQVRLWTAHYTYRPHICSVACGYELTCTVDATQWTNKSRGRNLDESLVADDVFDQPDPQPVPPASIISRAALGGRPVALIDVPFQLDAAGDGDCPAPPGFLAVSSAAVHDKYDPAAHDADTIVVAIGVRRSGTPSGWMLAVKGGPPSSVIHATVLIGE